MGEGKQLLIIALEPQAIARFASIASRFGIEVDCTPRPEMRQSGTPRPIGISVELAAWTSRLRENGNAYDVLYLRSSAIFLLESFTDSLQNASAAQTFYCRAMLHFDSIFQKYPTLSVEELYGPDAVQQVAGVLLGRSAADTPTRHDLDHPKCRESEYKTSVAQLLTGPRPALNPQNWPLLELEKIYPMGSGLPTTLLLELGWSLPEDSYVWSHAASASLLLPMAGIPRATRCQLTGFAVDNAVSINVHVGNTLVASLGLLPGNEPREVLLEFALPDADTEGPDVVRVVLELQGMVCPKRLGMGDDVRELCFALRSLKLHNGPRRSPQASPRVLEPRATALALLVVGPAGEDMKDALDFCRRTGCSSVLPVQTDEKTLWHHDWTDGCCRLLPPCRGFSEAFDRIARTEQRAEIIVLWNPAHPAAVADALARLFDERPGFNIDLALKAVGLDAFEPLQPWIQDHSRVVTVADGLVRVKLHAPTGAG